MARFRGAIKDGEKVLVADRDIWIGGDDNGWEGWFPVSPSDGSIAEALMEGRQCTLVLDTGRTGQIFLTHMDPSAEKADFEGTGAYPG